MNTRLQRNIWLLYLYCFLFTSLILIPVIVPFFESRGLSLAEVFYLQASFALFVVLFEVPSGYIADLLGRKNALVAGALFHGAGFTWVYFADGFADLLIFEFLMGIAISLMSGADLSLLYDTQEALEQSTEDKTRGIANMRFAKSVAEGVSALLSGWMIMYSMDAVVIANAVVGWLPLVVSVFLTEAPFVKMEKGQTWQNLSGIVGHLLFGERLLRYVVLAIMFWGLSTFYVVWMLQPYWADQGVPLTLFGILWAAQSFLFAFATRITLPLEKKFGAAPLLIAMALLPVAGYLGMATLGGVIGILASFLFFASRGINQVLLTDALNRRVPSSFRSTANSMSSLGFRLVYIITGPLVGLSLDGFGLYATLALLGIASLVLMVVLLPPLLREVRMVERKVPVAAAP
ncbi:MAG: MFS transporter [Pseudomonadales bacterium]|nr:MFS transporter [Pseudomonadales bacterium]